MTASKTGAPPAGVTPAHVDFIAHERRKGTSWEGIAQVVGVAAKTLSTWWAKRMPNDAPGRKRYTPRYAAGLTPNTARAGPRKCLSCQITFDSEGPHNRLCNTCRTAD
jgi:hypothetical protein